MKEVEEEAGSKLAAFQAEIEKWVDSAEAEEKLVRRLARALGVG